MSQPPAASPNILRRALDRVSLRPTIDTVARRSGSLTGSFAQMVARHTSYEARSQQWTPASVASSLAQSVGRRVISRYSQFNSEANPLRRIMRLPKVKSAQPDKSFRRPYEPGEVFEADYSYDNAPDFLEEATPSQDWSELTDLNVASPNATFAQRIAAPKLVNPQPLDFSPPVLRSYATEAVTPQLSATNNPSSLESRLTDMGLALPGPAVASEPETPSSLLVRPEIAAQLTPSPSPPPELVRQPEARPVSDAPSFSTSSSQSPVISHAAESAQSSETFVLPIYREQASPSVATGEARAASSPSSYSQGVASPVNPAQPTEATSQVARVWSATGPATTFPAIPEPSPVADPAFASNVSSLATPAQPPALLRALARLEAPLGIGSPVIGPTLENPSKSDPVGLNYAPLSPVWRQVQTNVTAPTQVSGNQPPAWLSRVEQLAPGTLEGLQHQSSANVALSSRPQPGQANQSQPLARTDYRPDSAPSFPVEPRSYTTENARPLQTYGEVARSIYQPPVTEAVSSSSQSRPVTPNLDTSPYQVEPPVLPSLYQPSSSPLLLSPTVQSYQPLSGSAEAQTSDRSSVPWSALLPNSSVTAMPGDVQRYTTPGWTSQLPTLRQNPGLVARRSVKGSTASSFTSPVGESSSSLAANTPSATSLGFEKADFVYREFANPATEPGEASVSASLDSRLAVFNPPVLRGMAQTAPDPAEVPRLSDTVSSRSVELAQPGRVVTVAPGLPSTVDGSSLPFQTVRPGQLSSNVANAQASALASQEYSASISQSPTALLRAVARLASPLAAADEFTVARFAARPLAGDYAPLPVTWRGQTDQSVSQERQQTLATRLVDEYGLAGSYEAQPQTFGPQTRVTALSRALPEASRAADYAAQSLAPSATGVASYRAEAMPLDYANASTGRVDYANETIERLTQFAGQGEEAATQQLAQAGNFTPAVSRSLADFSDKRLSEDNLSPVSGLTDLLVEIGAATVATASEQSFDPPPLHYRTTSRPVSEAAASSDPAQLRRFDLPFGTPEAALASQAIGETRFEGLSASESSSLQRVLESATPLQQAMRRIEEGSLPLERRWLAEAGATARPFDYTSASFEPIHALSPLAFRKVGDYQPGQAEFGASGAAGGFAAGQPLVRAYQPEVVAGLSQPSFVPLADATQASHSSKETAVSRSSGPASFVAERLTSEEWAARLPSLRDNPGKVVRLPDYTPPTAPKFLTRADLLGGMVNLKDSSAQGQGATEAAASLTANPFSSTNSATSPFTNSSNSPSAANPASTFYDDMGAVQRLTHLSSESREERLESVASAAQATVERLEAAVAHQEEGLLAPRFGPPTEQAMGVVGMAHPLPPIQRKATADTPASLPPVDTILRTSVGQPLANTVQTRMTDLLGAKFDHVRVHTDDQAASYVARAGAEAFTVGPNIFFATGRYQPETVSGQALIGHELTHVIQQANLPSLGQGRIPETSSEGRALEHEALHTEQMLLTHLSSPVHSQAATTSSLELGPTAQSRPVQRTYTPVEPVHLRAETPVQRESDSSAPGSAVERELGSGALNYNPPAAQPSEPETSAEHLEIDKIAREVFQLLKQQLLVERERSGHYNGRFY